MGASVATNRVQAGHDLTSTRGETVQVRYLANPAGAWINEHRITAIPDVDTYALVLFEAFIVVGVLAFGLPRLAGVGETVGKRHGEQERRLELTSRDWVTIRDDPHGSPNSGCGMDPHFGTGHA